MSPTRGGEKGGYSSLEDGTTSHLRDHKRELSRNPGVSSSNVEDAWQKFLGPPKSLCHFQGGGIFYSPPSCPGRLQKKQTLFGENSLGSPFFEKKTLNMKIEKVARTAREKISGSYIYIYIAKCSETKLRIFKSEATDTSVGTNHYVRTYPRGSRLFPEETMISICFC